MLSKDQLEIIKANGEIEFYDLDPAKGITNIGRDPENDIVIDSPSMAPFYAMLDHRQKPFQLTVLSQEGTTKVGGQALAPYIPRDFQTWDSIEIDGHSIILTEGGGGAAASPGPAAAAPISFPSPAPAAPGPARDSIPPPVISPPPVRPAAVPPPATRPEGPGSSYDSPPEAAFPAPAPIAAASPSQRPTGLFTTLPPDQDNEAIIVDLSEREWTIDVEQMVTFQVTITNGGPLVANFGVSVQGLDQSWLEISQPYVNLYEGENATITITITPPREPTSRAGAHYFVVLVNSDNYRGHSQRGATLIINPYYEFAVGELSPKRQAISWFKRFGRAIVPITNKGNSDAPFRLESADEERACSFEFDVPGEVAPLATQAELRLSPEETSSIPMRITPHSRRLIGLRRRSYNYTVITNLSEGGLTPRSMLGVLKQSALIGPWLLLLMALLLMVVIILIVRPRLYTFMLAENGGTVAKISNGTPVAMRWRASYFTSDLAIEPSIEGLQQPIPREGTVVAFPKADQTYTLKGDNLLSYLVPSLFAPPTRAINVDVTPIAPGVSFKAEPARFVAGEGEVVLSWLVENADEIKLFRQIADGGALEPVLDFSGQPSGALHVTPDPNQNKTTYILMASNAYAPTATPVPQQVVVVTPTPTMPPTPAIVLFSANPPVINEGEESLLSWLVHGVQEITIEGSGVQSIQPPEYQMSVKPTGSTDYILSVPGVPPRPVRVDVIAATATPTATPEPNAPEITLFAADPAEVVKGDSTDVKLSWTVVGTTTNVELNSPELPNPLSNLLAQGSYQISLDDAALFVLTAFNDTAKDSASVQIEAKDPTPTPTPAPTSTPEPTPLPVPNIVNFEAVEADDSAKIDRQPDESGDKKNVYQVVAGSNVRLRWTVQNDPSNVTLVGTGGTSAGRAPTENNYFDDSLDPVENDGEYTLIAENKDGAKDQYVIEIQAVSQDPPPAPVNFKGSVVVSGTNAFRWNYDPDFKEDIKGFRIYRSDFPGFPDFPAADESKLGPGDDTWTDDSGNHCGEIYYIVAVYEDIITGAKEETDSAIDSWIPDEPCPPP